MKKREKLCPDVDGPKYGIPFDIVGFQAVTENGNYTELVEIPKVKKKIDGITAINERMITLKTRREYIKWKWDLSKLICDAFNKSLKIKWDKIVSVKVKYLLHVEDHYI